MYLGNGVCDAVALVDAAGVRALDVTLPDGLASLADPFVRPCPETVNARWPSWSPDGPVLAVFVSTDARGMDGAARADAPYELYLLDPLTGSLTRRLTGLRDPRALAWSPDGRWLAFAEYDESGRIGGRVIRVAGDAADGAALDLPVGILDLAWSPSGRSLVALVDRSGTDGSELASIPVVIDASWAGRLW